MADSNRPVTKGLDAIVEYIHPQALTDQLWRRVKRDTFDQESAGPRDWNNGLGEVCGAPCRRRMQLGTLRPLPVAPSNLNVHKAPVVVEGCKFAAAAQGSGPWQSFSYWVKIDAVGAGCWCAWGGLQYAAQAIVGRLLQTRLGRNLL